MEIICYALDIEAKPLQKHFGDKVHFEKCEVYAKNLKFLKDVSAKDHVTNIGVCAGSKIGQIFACNKIIGSKTYYPDMLTPCNLKQKTIKTVDYLVKSDEILNNPDLLYDQEAAIIFAEAQKHIAPHQISFLKIVSDSGVENFNEVRKLVPKLIEAKIPEIEEFITSSQKFFAGIKAVEEIKDLEKYAAQLKCTETMKHRLATLLRYAQISNIDVAKFLSSKKPTTKQESLKSLDELSNFLIG